MKTRQWLLTGQHEDGYWCAELEGDTILESEYILLLAWLGRENEDVAREAAEYIRRKQLPDGGWAMYPGGKVEISGSVKAYFALKLTGHPVDADYMKRARAAILAHGGADAVNSFTRFYLALLGQVSYDQCPAVPPEMILLPTWLPINLYRISTWSRTIVVPLSIMWAHRPVRQIDPNLGIRELFIREPEDWGELRCPGTKASRRWFSWDRFFHSLDRWLKWADRHRLMFLRRPALKKAEAWIVERFSESDGLGAIFPPIIWSVVALKCLGYDDDSPEVRDCHQQLRDLMIRENGTVRLQPCKSPVWDTALTLRALSASGVSPKDEPVRRATRWLLSKEVTRRGDWAKTTPAEPGGWFFEHNNAFYPDIDDTAMVLMVLRDQFAKSEDASHAADKSLPPELHIVAEETADNLDEAREQMAFLDRVAAASQRAKRWTLAMQNRDGGWGAFDRDNDAEFLCHVPFADHNAMIDPSTPDLAARVLEALAQWGMQTGEPAVDRAVAYLRATQEPDGSWLGRWGVNYVYGTWQVLVGLAEAGVPRNDPAVTAGANWLLTYQQQCGGWGESPASYDDPSLRGQGPPTPSQTAWALLGLLAAGYEKHTAVADGIGYLLAGQKKDGTWDETEFTGTGFPRVFYLRYHLYPVYFPLMALSRFTAAVGAKLEEADDVAARLVDVTRAAAKRKL